MGLRLKENLLIEILSPHNSINKYSKGLLNLKTIIQLESEEKFKLSTNIINLYQSLVKKENNFIENIPLSIIEKYYVQKMDNMNSYIYIQFRESELNMKTNELFILLENYYKEMFLVASLIASFYNLEIKINSGNENNEFI